MSVQATYEVCVDLNNDRAFGGANEDISAYWKSISWRNGAAKPFDTIARTNTMRMVLDNRDGRFSPEHGSALAGFNKGILIRIRTTYSATTRTMFIGWIQEIRPVPGSNMRRETVIEADGYFEKLMQRPVSVAVQESKTIDQIIIAILNNQNVYPPGFTGWLLGIGGYSELGQASYLGTGASDYSDMETGIHTFNVVGDNWGAETSIYRAFSDLIDAENGFIYENREGLLALLNRHYWILDQMNPLDGTITENDILRDNITYRYGEGLLNDYTITCRPRTIGTSVETIARMTSTPSVPAGQSKEVTIRYSDDGAGTNTGGKDTVFAANTDWTANSKGDGSGTNLTGSVTASTLETGTGLRVTFTNNAGETAFIRPGSTDPAAITVRGKKITDYGSVDTRYVDLDSIADYGLQADKRQMILLDDVDYAQALAEWEVLQRGQPAGDIEALEIILNKSDAMMIFGLSKTIGDRLAVSESQTGVSGEYFIVGENHTVQNSQHHTVHYVLRPVSPQSWWILGQSGYSELGQTTYLGV